MPHALPLLFELGPGEDASGSALLFTHKGELRLCTAAHVPLFGQMCIYEGRQFPHQDWQRWPQTMHVLDPATLHDGITVLASLPLFANGNPLFGFIDVDGERIADLLVLRLDDEQDAALASFTRFVLGAEWPQIDMTAIAIGHPRIVAKGSPSIQPLHEQAATIVGIAGELVEHDYLLPVGMSGGPLISPDGNLLGMNFGRYDEEGKGMAVGQAAIGRVEWH